MQSNVSFDPSKLEHQGMFRNDAAGCLKAMILARAKAEPKFLTQELRDLWWKPSNDHCPDLSNLAATGLLRDAANMFRRFQTAYSGSQDSIAAPQTDAEILVEELKELILSFVDVEALQPAVKRLTKGAQVEWKVLAKWNDLGGIRDKLDRLPQANQTSSETELDGPIPPDGFCYQGVVRRGCQPTPWRLIKTLWYAKNRSVKFEKLAEPVWGDPNASFIEGAIASARKNANGFLRKKSLPFLVTIKNRHASLVTTNESEAEVKSLTKKAKKRK